MDDLEELARRWGVERGYHDIFGNWRVTPDGTVRAVIAALSRHHPEPARPVPAPRPIEAFQGDSRRLWGIAVQLYSVRSNRNWGIGDFRDLRDIICIAARAGASAVGLNPLHALFLDRPQMASPYAPNSRLFLNPLYIALDDLDWFDASPFAEQLAEFGQTDLVDYQRVAKLKLSALRVAYKRFLESASSQNKEEFEAFRIARGDSLARFACFEVLRARYGPAWKDWPPQFVDADANALAELARTDAQECGLVQFMQWLADSQLARCREEAANNGMPIGLYLDLAIGVDPRGADAWINQRSTVVELSVGAPPDEFQPAGQNWGLAPFNPHALPENNFAAFRELLAAPMRHAGAVRLDHVLGLMRLYVVPRGTSDADGTYIRFPFEQLLRVVAEESRHYRCIFIGEDLGTVPAGFRETAARWGVWSYRVMIFERRHDGSFTSPPEYPAQALATFNTHDLPTFAGWRSGHDLRVKRALGLDLGEDDEQRERSRQALHEVLSQYRGDGQPEFAAVASFLGATPSRLVMMSIEDLLGVADQVNIPGTVEQHPNWRRKLPVTLEEWEKQPLFSAVAHQFERGGRRF